MLFKHEPHMGNQPKKTKVLSQTLRKMIFSVAQRQEDSRGRQDFKKT